MSLNFADLIVMGDDISGVAAGSLLAKRGFNVMVVDRPTSKNPISLAGLEGRSFKSFISKVGIPETRLRPIRKNDTSFQIVLPEHRIDVGTDEDHLLEEMAREFPRHQAWSEKLFEEVEAAHEEEARPLLSRLPWTSWREKRRFLKQKKQIGWPKWTEALQDLPSSMQAFFKAWLLFLSENPTGCADTLQPFSLFAAENRGTSTVKGGWTELKRIFFEKIEYYGGTIMPEPPADYLFEAESSSIKGIIFDGYHFSTRCRYLLGNDPFSEQVAHIPRTFRTRRYCRQMSRRPAVHKYTIRFLTSSAILPEPMCQNIVCVQDPTKALIDTNYFQVHMNPLPQPPAPDEDTVLEVSYYLPSDYAEPLTHEGLESFEARHENIEAALHGLIPFARGHLRRVFPLPGQDQSELFSGNDQDYTPFLQRARHEGRYPPSFSFPGFSTPYDNLFSIGPDQLSWLGFPGRVQSALKAVDCIWDRESKQKRI